MKILIDKIFQKDWKKIKDKGLNQRLFRIIEQAQEVSSLSEILHLKKLSGSNNFYRIRIGEYRIGLELEGDIYFLSEFSTEKISTAISPK